MATTAEQASPWLKGALLRLLEGRVRPQRLPDLRTRSACPIASPKFARRWRRISRAICSAATILKAPKTNRVYAPAGEVACLRRARDPSARHGLCRSRTRRELPRCPPCSRSTCIPARRCSPGTLTTAAPRFRGPVPRSASRTFWAIDDTTEQNGATEIIPGSHLWDGQYIEGAVQPAAFHQRSRSRRGRPAGRRQADHAVGIAGHHQGNAVAPRRRQPVRPAAPDHHAAILRGLGAAAREHGARRARRSGEPIAGARPRADRLFDPSAVHGICRRRPSQAACCERSDGSEAWEVWDSSFFPFFFFPLFSLFPLLPPPFPLFPPSPLSLPSFSSFLLLSGFFFFARRLCARFLLCGGRGASPRPAHPASNTMPFIALLRDVGRWRRHISACRHYKRGIAACRVRGRGRWNCSR